MNFQSSKRMSLGRRGYCDTSWLLMSAILLATSFSAVESKNCSFYNEFRSKICIFSSLHADAPVPTERVLYPVGVPLNLTCQARVDVIWKLPQTFHNHKKLFAKFVKLNTIKIPELTHEHDNLKFECITKNHDGKAEISLSVISPPKVSIEALTEKRTIQCEVTENWTPDLQLCLITEEKMECHNKRRISLSYSSIREVTKVICRPSLRKFTNFNSLNEQAKLRFEEMFNEAQVGLPFGGKEKGALRGTPFEVVEDTEETILDSNDKLILAAVVVLAVIVVIGIGAIACVLVTRRKKPNEHLSGHVNEELIKHNP